jgi:hypothetical protein
MANTKFKTPCPISRATFRQEAKPVVGQLNGGQATLEPKEFSTGSLGWYYNGPVTVEIGGVKVKCSAQLQLIIANSKELPG